MADVASSHMRPLCALALIAVASGFSLSAQPAGAAHRAAVTRVVPPTCLDLGLPDGAAAVAGGLGAATALGAAAWFAMFGPDDEEVAAAAPVVADDEGELLQLPFSSASATLAPNGLLLTMQLLAKEGNARNLASALRSMVQDANQRLIPASLMDISVSQDPEERTFFVVTERFATQEDMAERQRDPSYRSFLSQVEPFLAKSIGMSLCHERNGAVSPALYPFGPCGEGGRDDMVFR